MGTFVSPSCGALRVVHSGMVISVCVVKLSLTQPLALPKSLNGIILTNISVLSGKLFGKSYDVILPRDIFNKSKLPRAVPILKI